jgi:hypothetical protein
MAGIELCKFTHGLGLYIRILPRAIAKDKIWAGKFGKNSLKDVDSRVFTKMLHGTKFTQ